MFFFWGLFLYLFLNFEHKSNRSTVLPLKPWTQPSSSFINELCVFYFQTELAPIAAGELTSQIPQMMSQKLYSPLFYVSVSFWICCQPLMFVIWMHSVGPHTWLFKVNCIQVLMHIQQITADRRPQPSVDARSVKSQSCRSWMFVPKHLQAFNLFPFPIKLACSGYTSVPFKPVLLWPNMGYLPLMMYMSNTRFWWWLI